MDYVNAAVMSSDGKVASEEKELLKAAENGEVTDKVMEEVVDELLVSIDKIMAFVTFRTQFFWPDFSNGVSWLGYTWGQKWINETSRTI